MKRAYLLGVIEELKDSDDIEGAIDHLRDIAVDFCDHYEAEFISIRTALSDLSPHIDRVGDAYEISERGSTDLY